MPGAKRMGADTYVSRAFAKAEPLESGLLRLDYQLGIAAMRSRRVSGV
jgi:hypothetical protein